MAGSSEGFKHLTEGRFVPRPGVQLGAVDSVHEVFFGRLGDKDVVVKPHTNELTARHEEQMLRIALRSGIRAVKAVGVYVDNSDAYLVTHHEPLISAAGLPLAKRDNLEVARSVSDVARALAEMHGKGMSHGDAQIKNFGLVRDLTTDRPPIITYDFEKAGTDTVGHVKTDPFGHDVDSLAQSLAYKGFGGSDLDLAAGHLEEFVLEPYAVEASRLGLDPTNTARAVEGAYGEFIDVRDKVAFAQTHSGHGPGSRAA